MVIDNTSTVSDIVSTELPAIMTRLQNWWTTWDEIHESRLAFLALIQLQSGSTLTRTNLKTMVFI